MSNTIIATAFNGTVVEAKVKLYVETLNFNPRQQLENKLIAPAVYRASRDKILEKLSKMYPQQALEVINFSIISSDLEELVSIKFKVHDNGLTEAIVASVLNYLAMEIGFGYQEDVKQPEVYLRQNESRFIARFLSSPVEKISNSKLQEAMDSYHGQKFVQASDIMKEINPDNLNDYDHAEWDWLSFAIRTKLENAFSHALQEHFEQVLAKYADRPPLFKRYYFQYIEFLEDVRNAKMPRGLLSLFEKRYPLSLLDDDEAVVYHRLKGRAEYHRGEFLVALEHFSSALKRVDNDDLKSKAAIYNSAANCFTDNLFFESAHWIASQAQEWRRVLDLPQTYESIGCMAGVETKRKNYARALELHHKADELIRDMQITGIDLNRHYNLLAKNYILVCNYALGKEYLDKAEEAEDGKDFSQYLRLLLYFRQGSYEQMDKLFNLKFRGNDEYDEFVLGWGNALMARAAFAQQRFDAAIPYLEDAISWFLKDLYILEARMVSLYGFACDLPREYQDKIMQIIFSSDIDARFEEYVAKHAVINDRFYPSFNPESGEEQGKPRLIQLAETIREINNNKYDAHEIRHFIDSYCLY